MFIPCICYISIYIYRERDVYIYIYTHTYIHIYIYIYVYIYIIRCGGGASRSRPRPRGTRTTCSYPRCLFMYQYAKICLCCYVCLLLERLVLTTSLRRPPSSRTFPSAVCLFSLSQAAASHKSSQRGQQYNILWK